MRVAYLNQDPGIELGAAKGAAVHVEALRRALVEEGAQLVAVDEKDANHARRALEAAHASGRLDLVYERYALGADVGAEFSLRSGVPLFLEVNAPLLDEARAHRQRSIAESDRARETRCFQIASRILAVSNAVADYALRAGAAPSAIEVVPNAVDSRRFAPLSQRSQARRSLGVDDRFVLGFHGRLRPWHGFSRIAAVAGRLAREGVDVHVVTLGAGDFARELSAHLPRSRTTHVDWLPHDEVPRIVGCFDTLALGYDAGGPAYFSPLKLLEAMAVGAVPVVPRVGDLEQVVEHGVHGLCYPAGDEDALFVALSRLWSDRALWATLSRAAVARARERSWSNVARRVLDGASRVACGR